MMFFSTINYFDLLLFIQLFCISFVLLLPMERRPHFYLRLAACFVAFGVSVYFLPVFFFQNPVASVAYGTFSYVTIAATTFGTAMICYKVNPLIGLFIATGSYAIQHLSSELDNLALKGITALFQIQGEPFWLKNVSIAVISILTLLAVYWISKKKRQGHRLHIRSTSALFFMVAAVGVDITLSSYRGRAMRGLDNPRVEGLVTAMFLVASLLIVIILFNLLDESRLKGDLAITDTLLKKEQEQWEVAKDVVESINIKTHDLKYRIRALRQGGEVKAGELEDIENDISLYENSVHTGNEALDILLTERMAFCKKNNIILTLMADGGCLRFVELPDLYSLLGNALSNAIEATMRISEPEKRVISVIIKESMGFASIHIENYFETIEKNDQGNLRTTKEDPRNHGFGVKSMFRIVERYNGTLSLTQKGDVFFTDILLPTQS